MDRAQTDLIDLMYEPDEYGCWTRDDIPFYVEVRNGKYYLGVEVYDLGIFDIDGLTQLTNIYENYAL